VTDFAIKNLKEVEDSAADRGADIEARFARKHLSSDHLGVSYFRYGPGAFEGLELIAVGSDRPEGGDGEMVQEFWTD
jgi:hypothetical protein